MKKLGLLASLLCALYSRPGVCQPAAEPSPSATPPASAAPILVVPDKLTAEDPETLEPGAVELELFYFDSSGRTLQGHDARSRVLSTSLSVGLVEDLDFSLLGGFSDFFDAGGSSAGLPGGSARLGTVQGPARGSALTALQGELRWRFYTDPELDLSLAYVAGVAERDDLAVTPLGSFVSPGNFYTFDSSLVARKNWGRFTLDAELYASLPVAGSMQGRYSQAGLNLAAGYQVTGWLQPVVELGYLRLQPQGPTQENLSATVGVVVTPLDFFSCYAGWQQTLATRNDDFFNTWFFGTSFQL